MFMDLFRSISSQSKIKGIVLGNGGVSKSIKYVLEKSIEFITVSEMQMRTI